MGNGLAGLVEGDPQRQHEHLEAHAVGGCLADAARHAAVAATAGQNESDVNDDLSGAARAAGHHVASHDDGDVDHDRNDYGVVILK